MKRLLVAICFAGGLFAQVVPSYKDLKYPPLPQVKIPEPTTFTLANGMKVFLLEDHELPLVHGLALIRTGNLFDPQDKKGLSEFTAEALRRDEIENRRSDR
jgi:zinc protease